MILDTGFPAGRVKGARWWTLLFRWKTEDVLYVASGVKNPDDLERLGFEAINNQIRVDQEEPMPAISQVFAQMTDTAVCASR